MTKAAARPRATLQALSQTLHDPSQGSHSSTGTTLPRTPRSALGPPCGALRTSRSALGAARWTLNDPVRRASGRIGRHDPMRPTTP